MFTYKNFKVGLRIRMKNRLLLSFWLALSIADVLYARNEKVLNWQNPLFVEALNLLQSARSLTLGTIAGGRLTAESGVPISVTDQVGKSTLYFTPYMGAKISLYSGGSWQIYDFSELSIALPSGSYGDVYDVFVYANSGSPNLELLAWAGPNTRSVALSYLNGVLVKATDNSRRYIGTVGLSGSGVTEDSEPRRFIWNLNNQVERYIFRVDVTSHSYDGPVRAFNGNTSSRLEFIAGEQTPISATITYSLDNPSAGIPAGIGYDENACASYQGQTQYRRIGQGARQTLHNSYSYDGYNYLCIVQGTETSGSATFYYYSALGELLM
jgi:hypothetical protein